MATICRVEKTRDYTIMSNHHLRNASLSLKAKGLMSLMLSLPDAWDYSIRGLTVICKEGYESISAGIKELENAGYIIRNRVRNEKGQLVDTEYIIHEYPQTADQSPAASPEPTEPIPAKPVPEKPIPENPIMDNPVAAHPGTDYPGQLSIDQINTELLKTELSMPDLSIYPQQQLVEHVRSGVREQIEFDTLIEDGNRERIEEFVEIITEVMFITSPTMRIGQKEYMTAVVKDRMRQLSSTHIQYVLDSLDKTAPNMHRTPAYLLSCLFNAPSSISNHYTSKVNHDRFNAGLYADLPY